MGTTCGWLPLPAPPALQIGHNIRPRACPQIFDRLAKGVREAPSKALIGELAAASGDSPAAAFGLRQSLATLGALGGALAAGAALRLTRRNYPLTFALSTVPAALALALLVAAFGSSSGSRAGQHVGGAGPASVAGPAGCAEAGGGGDKAAALGPLGRARTLLGALRPAYWQALATVALLYMARFDAGFAVLRAKEVWCAAVCAAGRELP